jgi:hypothetical protein
MHVKTTSISQIFATRTVIPTNAKRTCQAYIDRDYYYGFFFVF